jgi:hypothetical protein
MTNQPTYTWNAVPGSSQYYLSVNDSTGPKIQQWYTAQEAGCPNGTGNCSVTPSTPLAEGGGQWWIQAYIPATNLGQSLIFSLTLLVVLF